MRAPALLDEFTASGVEPAGALHEAEWCHRVFSITDLEGNTMRFGSPR